MSEHRDNGYPRGTEWSQNGDGFQEEWSELCALLDAADPSEVVARVRDLRQQPGPTTLPDYSSEDRLVAVSEVEKVIRDMHDRLNTLRQRNEALVAQLGNGSEPELQKAFRDLHNDSFQIFEALNVATAPEAIDRVRSLRRQLDSLYREKEMLANAGLGTPQRIVEAMKDLRASEEAAKEATKDLETKHDQLQEGHRQLQEKHRQLQSEMKARGEKLSQLTGTLDDVKSQKDALKRDAAAAHQRAEHLAADLEAARKDLASTRQNMEAREQSRDATAHELKQARAELDRAANRVRSLQSQLDERTQEINALQAERSELQAAHAEASAALKEAQAEAEQLRTKRDEEVADLRAHLQEARQRVEQAESRCKALEEKLRAMQQTADQAAQQAATAKEEASRIADESKAIRAERDNLQRSVDHLESVLGVRSLEEAQELERLVRGMHESLYALTQEKNAVLTEVGLASMDGVLDMIRSLEAQLVDLYQQIGDATGMDEIQSILGISSVEQAREMAEIVRSMREQLNSLAAEKQLLYQEVGLKDADRTLAMIRSMEAQLAELYSNQEQAPEAADTSAQEVVEVLGVKNAEEARRLAEMVRSLAERHETLTQQQKHFEQMGIEARHALAMIESMEQQLLDLYKDREAGLEAHAMLEDIEAVLGVRSLEEAQELERLVRSLYSNLQTLIQEKDEVLTEVGLASMDGVLDMIRSLEAQLVDLYQQMDEGSDLGEIQGILGVYSPEQARELSEIAQIMEQQLSSLYEEKQQLASVGLASVEDAVAMIESMEHQLRDLYSDKEAESKVGALVEGQDTFDQLQLFYAEQEKLERELGVSSSEAIVEMVQGLVAQLEVFYEDIEHHSNPYLSHGDGQSGADRPSLMSERVNGSASSADSTELQQTLLMLQSMEEQLNELYADREKLSSSGIDSVEDALGRIQRMTERINHLISAKEAHEHKLNHLTQVLGVSTPDHLVQRIQELKASSAHSTSAASSSPDSVFLHPGRGWSDGPSEPSVVAPSPAPSQAAASMGPQTYFRITGTLPFVPDSLLERLDTLPNHMLDQLPFGVMRLDDNATVDFVNKQGLHLPGLDGLTQDDVAGRHFFTDVAPGANNTIFHGRFREGVDEGEIDAVFPYTFTRAGLPPSVQVIHLYRKSRQAAYWMLFKSIKS